MADGRVTIQVSMDGQQARSETRGLKALLEGLTGSVGKTGSMFKSMLGANIIGNALTGALGSIKNGVAEIATELTSSTKAWKTFEGNLSMLGKSAEEIGQVKAKLQDYATQTIYSASDMAQTYSQLAAVGIESTDQLVTGFGGLAAAAENPQQAMKTLSQQGVQMAAKPKVAWQDFKLMLEQTPAGIAAVAREMGMSTDEMVQAVQDGKIATNDFFDAIKKVGNSAEFTKLATEFKTVDQAIDGAKETLTNKLLPAFDVVNKHGIKAVVALTNALDSVDFGALASNLDKALSSINVEKIVQDIRTAFGTIFNDLNGAKLAGAMEAVRGAIDAVGNAFASAGGKTAWLNTISNIVGAVINTFAAGANIVKNFVNAFAQTGAMKAAKAAIDGLVSAYNNIVTSIGNSSAWSALGTIIGNVANVIGNVVAAVGNFIGSLDPSIIQGVAAALAGLVVGFKAFSFLQSFNPFGLFGRNAADGVGQAVQGVSRGKGIISQLMTGLANIIKSSGTAISTAAKGIGQGIKAALSGAAPAIRAFGAALKTAGVGNILAFGGAVAIAAVGIGAGVAIIAAGFALLASQSEGISAIINAVGQAFATVATAIIGAFAQAIVTVAGVLPTVTQALAGLAPLVVAFGQAFAAAAPFVTALGQAITSIAGAFPPVINAISQGAATIIGALTPIAEIVGNVFTNIAQIVANAIVQIIQALAPFMPAVSEMVQALAPVLQSIVEAFTTLVSQISPIIDSIANLFKTLGNAIKSVLDGAKGVIEGFGNSVKSILDGVSGVIKSIGQAALNAGNGFKALAQGVVMITNTNLGDMAASLAAVATGVGKIAGSAGGMASAGAGMKQLGAGLALIQASGTSASAVLVVLAAKIPMIGSSVSQLAPAMTTAASGFRAFATSAMSSLSGLVASTAILTQFSARITSLASSFSAVTAGAAMFANGFAMINSVLSYVNGQFTATTLSVTMLRGQIATVPSAFMQVGASAISATAQIRQIGSSAPIIGASMRAAASQVIAAMAQMVQAVVSGGQRMIAAGRQAGTMTSQNLAAGIRGGVGAVTGAVASLVSAAASRAYAGAGSMRGAGYQIGAGLAQGMYAALGAVTAAANALVAQAERAAQAKARIHSPSRLFRDEVGRYIPQGVAVGIEKNTDYVEEASAAMFDKVGKLKARAEDFIGTGKSSLASTVRAETASRQTVQQQVEVIRKRTTDALDKALEVAKKAVERPVQLDIDSRRVAETTGPELTRWQSKETKLRDRGRGIK